MMGKMSKLSVTFYLFWSLGYREFLKQVVATNIFMILNPAGFICLSMMLC